MPNPARPPTTRLIDSAVDTAPRLQPKASTTRGRKTPKAARGMAMPQVTRKRPATISQRRADGRSRRLLTLEPSGRDRPRSASGGRTGAAGGSSRWNPQEETGHDQPAAGGRAQQAAPHAGTLRKRPATISQRRAGGRSRRLLALGTEGTGRLT